MAAYAEGISILRAANVRRQTHTTDADPQCAISSAGTWGNPRTNARMR
jgi:hypothetical protein